MKQKLKKPVYSAYGVDPFMYRSTLCMTEWIKGSHQPDDGNLFIYSTDAYGGPLGPSIGLHERISREQDRQHPCLP